MKRVLQRKPVKFALEIVNIYFSKHVARSAAQLAFFLVLSFFPLLICVNAFIGLLDVNISSLLAAAAPFFPSGTLDFLVDYVQYISDNQSSAMLVAGIVMTLISASAAFRALMNIMSDIYERKTYKGFGQLLASLIFSVLFLVTIYLAIGVLFTGGWLLHLIQDLFHLNSNALPWNWRWLRFVLLFCLVLFFIMLVYRMSAPRGKPRPPIFAGALIASVALVAATAVFSLFIGVSSRYSLVYGSLASIIILLVWLYLCGNILILGNVFNCIWYRRRKQVYQQHLSRPDKPVPGDESH